LRVDHAKIYAGPLTLGRRIEVEILFQDLEESTFAASENRELLAPVVAPTDRLTGSKPG
jgi:hypothetical protein